ncbi:MAG: heparinase II/III family protein [Kofleriaceae bacterium]
MTSCSDPQVDVPDAVAVEPVALVCTHPVFYQPADYSVTSMTVNAFGKSQQGEWTAIRNAADAVLPMPGMFTQYSTYRLHWPYLQPFPHGTGSSLAVGTAATSYAWVRRPLPAALPSAYLVEFNYFYASAAEQNDFMLFSSYNDVSLSYTGVTIRQTGSQLSTSGHPNFATITENAWHQFALFVKSNGTYDLYIDGTLRVTGSSAPGAVTSIGFLGDISGSAFDGYAQWDNFRISDGPEILFQDLFDGAAIAPQWLKAESIAGSIALSSQRPYNVGSFPYWTGISREIERRLRLTAFAYTVTQDVKYANYAKPIMESLCGGGWDRWSDPDYDGGVMSLGGATFATGVAYAFDALAPAMSANDRQTFAQCLEDRGIAPLADEVSLDNDPATWPNGFAVRYAGLGIASLAASCELDESAALTQARTGLAMLYDAMDIDGGNIEGISYAAYAYDNSLTFHYFDHKVAGYNAFTHPYLAALPRFITHALVPSRTAFLNFADSDSSIANFGTTLAILHDQLGDPYALAQLGRLGWRPAQPLNLELYPTVASAPPVAGEPTGRSFREIGWGMLRSSWADTAMFVAMHSGPKTGHSHRDENGIVVWKDGNWLARDPGYQDYNPGIGHDFSHGSLGHNVVRVTTATKPSVDQANAAGALTAFYAAPAGGGYMQGDATAAYAPKVTAMRRTVSLLTDSECTVTTDVIANGSEASTIDFILHPEATNATASGNRFVVTKGMATTAYVDVFKGGGAPGPTLSVSQPDPWLPANPTATLKASASLAASATTWIMGAMCPQAITWSAYSAGPGAAALIGRQSGAPRHVLEVSPSLVGVPVFDLKVGAVVDVGTAGDDSIAAHTPGISLYPAEWDAATVESGLTVRSAALANANFLVNMSAVDTVPRNIAMLYKAPANLQVRQYIAGTYQTVAELVGDNVWRVVRFHARAPYSDYRVEAGVQVLFDLTAPITIAEMWLENEANGDLCDVGAAGDSTTAQHSPGVSVYPAEWGLPSVISGYTARTGPAGSNLYVNVDSVDKTYDIEVVYRASADLDLQQWIGSTYVNLSRLRGDGIIRRARVSLGRPYTDYAGMGADARINVLLNFSGAIDLIEVVGRGMK